LELIKIKTYGQKPILLKLYNRVTTLLSSKSGFIVFRGYVDSFKISHNFK